MNNDAYLEPFWAFLAKAEALKAETNASFTAAFCIWALITFLKGIYKKKKLICGRRGEGDERKMKGVEQRIMTGKDRNDIPCDGFCKYSSPTWRVPRLLPWALRPS
jgi:hypothetical protein